MTGIERARKSTRAAEEEARVEIAVGLLAERENLALEQARERLRDAAQRAGVRTTALANLLLTQHSVD
jgi:hypothetical protein